ncbi:MAG TPA: tetratricopeptide repeat protein [Terriglobia bacterium]|nr:tetratricopeptide repeat protein [Terriglobia bacterium]
MVYLLSLALSLNLISDGCLFAQSPSSPRPEQDRKPSAQSRIFQEKIASAKDLLARGLLPAAIERLRELVKEEPHDADVHLLLGTALVLTSDRSESILELRRAIELRPAFAPSYNTLGMALARFGELDAARRAYEEAIRLDPQFIDAHTNLSLVLAQRNEFALANDHISRAIELARSSTNAAYLHYLKGKIFSEQGKPEEAIKEFSRAIQLRSNYGEAYLALGLIKKKLQDEEGALHAFKKAVEFSPDNGTAQFELGAGYLRSNQTTEAIEHLEKARVLNPGERKVLYQLCGALHKANKTEEASTCEQKLLTLIKSSQTTDMSVAMNLNNEGVQLEKEGNWAAALDKYRAALKLFPSQTVFRRNLALVLCRLGRWEEGIAELSEVLRADSEDTVATRALSIAQENARKAKQAGGN